MPLLFSISLEATSAVRPAQPNPTGIRVDSTHEEVASTEFVEVDLRNRFVLRSSNNQKIDPALGILRAAFARARRGRPRRPQS